MLALAVPRAHAGDWPMYLKDPAHSSYSSAENAIGNQNIAGLDRLFATRLKGMLAAGVTIVNGTAYIGDWDGYFYAVDARAGTILWRQFVGLAADPQNPICQSSIGVSGQAA